MHKELEVTPLKMATRVNVMAELSRKLEKDLEALKESLTSLNGSWEGPAQQQFAAQFTVDYETMRLFCQIVKELQATFEFAKDEYIKCKQSVADVVAAIQI